ncbi:hypothetical protein SHIRM173S_06403 [Streptomyces hirsutus]
MDWAVSVAALLLCGHPVVVTGGGRLGARARLAVFDAVVGLLPYGVLAAGCAWAAASTGVTNRPPNWPSDRSTRRPPGACGSAPRRRCRPALRRTTGVSSPA